jgi:uncharacterized damage-inducible protein DinB
MAWADATVWNTVLRSEPARADPRIQAWLHHIHTVQQAFLQIWRDEPLRFREPSEFPDPESLCRWGREGHERYLAFWTQVTDDMLAREIRLPWAQEIGATANRTLAHPTLHQAGLQVAMHSTHHRGQVTARLRELGIDPPLIDYIAWVWWSQPEADWSFPGGRP